MTSPRRHTFPTMVFLLVVGAVCIGLAATPWYSYSALSRLRKQVVAATAAAHPSTLAEIEKQAILKFLEMNAGERRATAEQLGISLHTLQYRLKEYGIAGRD